jgi:prefoldin beta subunit
MEDIPPQIQQKIAQFQALQQQGQAVSSQKVQMELQLKDVEHGIEELKKLKKDAEVYKSIGSLLIKKNKTKINAELKERKETLGLRIKTLEKQEKDIQSKLMEMQNEIQSSIKPGEPQAG